MLSEGLHLSRDGNIAVLTLDRPKRRNAIHGPMWTALGTLPQVLAEDPPRALVVTGAGGHFSSGMDLQMDNPLLQRLMPALQEQDRDGLRALVRELKANVGAMRTLPFPVIAAVDGACAGGALEVALAADLIVASEDAWFSLPETMVGMVPDVGGTTRLSARIGVAKATELILTGQRMTSEEALQAGLVNRRVEGPALPAALALARETRRAAPGCARAVLKVLRREDNDMLDAETEAGIEGLLSGHVVEGVMAFAQRRDPDWY